MLQQTVKQNPDLHAPLLPNATLSLQLILRKISLLLGLKIDSMVDGELPLEVSSKGRTVG